MKLFEKSVTKDLGLVPGGFWEGTRKYGVDQQEGLRRLSAGASCNGKWKAGGL